MGIRSEKERQSETRREGSETGVIVEARHGSWSSAVGERGIVE